MHYQFKIESISTDTVSSTLVLPEDIYLLIYFKVQKSL